MSKPKLNILFSCVGTKTTPAVLNYDEIASPFEWIKQTHENPNKIKAMDLYGGPGWAQVKRIVDKLEEHYEVEPWIFSAGYGFLKGSDMVLGYNATFSSSAKSDRVKLKDQDYWLRGVSKWKLPAGTVLVLPKSYEKPFAFLDSVDRHILVQGTADDREDLGCSMIRCSTTLMEKIVDAVKDEAWKHAPKFWGNLRGYEV